MASSLELHCDTDCFDAEKVARLRPRLVEVEGLADVFKALGDPTRTKILFALSQEELCVHDIAQLLDSTPSAISHHLRLLRALRLVRYRKEGKVVRYSLLDEHIIHLIHEARVHLHEQDPPGAAATPKE